MPDLSTSSSKVTPDDRGCSARETLDRVMPLFPLFGITRVADVTGLDRIGLPVAMVCRPEAKSSAVFHGKGLDQDTARVSGVMEAVETWHAETVRGPLLHGSARELSGDLKIADLRGLPQSTDRPISCHDTLLWIEGQNLLSGASTWVPFEVVHASSALDGPPSSGLLAMDTNGLASGNTLPEAIAHGCCEVIERDASSLWRGLAPADRERRKIDLGTVQDPRCRQVLGLFSEAKFAVAAWDITTEVGVPAYYCLLKDDVSDVGHIGNGSGCHPSRDIALLRALTEAAQTRMTYIVGSREDISADDYADTTLLERNKAARRAIGKPGQRPLDDTEDLATATPEGSIALILERLSAAGFGQVLMIDLSRSLGGVAVTKLVIPYLEGAGHGRPGAPGPRYRARLQAYSA